MSASDLIKVCREALAAFPAEACGLLLGQGSQVRRVLPVENQAPEPDRFEISAPDLFAAHRLARAEGMVMVGHYHSHPNGLSRPSERDVAAIADPAALWLIVAVDPRAGRVTGVSAWFPAIHYPVDSQWKAGFRPAALLVLRGLKTAFPKKTQKF